MSRIMVQKILKFENYTFTCPQLKIGGQNFFLMIAIPFLTHFNEKISVLKSQGIENPRPR